MHTPLTIKYLLLKRVLLYIAASSLLVSLAWIGSGVYFSVKRTTLPADLQKKMIPLIPTIDIKTIQDLQNRRSFSEEELSSFPISKEIIVNKNAPTTPTPKPKVDVSKLATQSASPSTATDSAQTP